MIGKQVELWHTKYTHDAYTDQMGIKHPATVVLRKAIVTIRETLDLVGAWSEQVIPGGIWIAYDENGVRYTQMLDECSYAGCRSHWSGDGTHWITATPSGYPTPYINTDGTKAVPADLTALAIGGMI